MLESLTDLQKLSPVQRLQAVQEAIDSIRMLLQTVNFTLQEVTLTESQQVDIGFLYREMGTALDEMRKDCNAHCEKTSYALACAITLNALTSGVMSATAKGTLATAVADSKNIPLPPKKGDPKYREVLLELGFSEEAIENGLATLHYNNLQAWLTRKEQSGQKTPTKLSFKSEPTVSYRKHKN